MMAFIKSLKNGVVQIVIPDQLQLDTVVEPFPQPNITATNNSISTRSPGNQGFQKGFHIEWQRRLYNHSPKQLDFEESTLPTPQPYPLVETISESQKSTLVSMNSSVLARGRSIAEMSRILNSPEKVATNEPIKSSDKPNCLMIYRSTHPKTAVGTSLNSENTSHKIGTSHTQYRCRWHVPYQRPTSTSSSNQYAVFNLKPRVAPVALRMQSTGNYSQLSSGNQDQAPSALRMQSTWNISKSSSGNQDQAPSAPCMQSTGNISKSSSSNQNQAPSALRMQSTGNISKSSSGNQNQAPSALRMQSTGNISKSSSGNQVQAPSALCMQSRGNFLQSSSVNQVPTNIHKSSPAYTSCHHSALQCPGVNRFQPYIEDLTYVKDLGKLKDIKPYVISGWISKNYLSALRQKTNLVNEMLDNAVDQVGDIRPEVIKHSRRTSAAMFAKDLMFRMFTLDELNRTKRRFSLSLIRMGAIKRCVKRAFPDMTSQAWTARCLPQIRSSIRILFSHRVKHVIHFWKEMDKKEQ